MKEAPEVKRSDQKKEEGNQRSTYACRPAVGTGRLLQALYVVALVFLKHEHSVRRHVGHSAVYTFDSSLKLLGEQRDGPEEDY